MTDLNKKKRGLPQNYDNTYPWVISLGIGNNPDTPSPEAPPASPVTESIDYDYQSANRMADALKSHYDSHHDSMKPEHTSAITSYTIHSSIMNKHLFKKKDAIQSNGDYSDPVQDSRAEEISSAISSSKPFGKKITVYSGMHSTIPPHLIAEHGGIFHIPKFISTSTHPDIAKRFAGKNAEGERHIVKLDIPAYNKTGMFVGHISHKDDEHEYLIDKNQIVHVSHKLSSHVDDKGVTTHVWKGRILTDNEAKSYANSHPFAKAEYDTAMKMKGNKSVFESLVLEKEYEVPNLSKGMDMQRRSLPQIDLTALKKDFAGKYTETTLKTSSLIPTQKHFNFDKVETLIKKRTDKPIVVSKDNKIIDGHHRWIADHAVNGKSKAVVVHKNADELLDYLSKVDYTKSKTLKESVDTSEVWYHGTKHDIQSIDSKHFGTGHDENGPGFYMTSSANDASSYAHSGRGYYEGANVMPVHHAIKNPMPLGHVFQRKHIDHMIRNAPNLDDKLSDWAEVTPKNRESVIKRVVDSYHNYQDADSGRNGVNVINSIDKDFYSGGHSGELLKRVNEATGHDGIIIQRTPTVKHAVAWFPHQVKGIYGNKDTSKDGIMENESDE